MPALLNKPAAAKPATPAPTTTISIQQSFFLFFPFFPLLHFGSPFLGRPQMTSFFRDSRTGLNQSTKQQILFSSIFQRIFLSLSNWKRKQTFYWSITVFFLSLSSWNGGGSRKTVIWGQTCLKNFKVWYIFREKWHMAYFLVFVARQIKYSIGMVGAPLIVD